MKATTISTRERLESRSELSGKGLAEAMRSQPLLRLVAAPAPLKPTHPYRLRAGQFVLYENRICPVLRVTDCCATIAVPQKVREFTTLFGKEVRIKPKPKIVRIGSNSEIPIINPPRKGGRK
jgi:hypothetical protein